MANEKSSCSKVFWENSKDNSPVFPLYENYLQQRSLETHCQQPASLNWRGERKGSLTYMKWVFSRTDSCRGERDRRGEGRRGESKRWWKFRLWHHRESISHAVCLWTFITLVNARQTVRDLWNPSDVKVLTHADYSGGHSPLSLITGCQGEHSLHMWAWKIHMLLIKGYLRFWWFQVQCRLVMSDQTETDPRRLKIDQQINRELTKNTWETDMDIDILYITAHLHWYNVN